MTVYELIEKISLQDEIKNKVILHIENNMEEYETYIKNLSNPLISEKTFEDIYEIYKEDNDNIHLLSINLLTAVYIYDEYNRKNIKDEIYIETMKCFTRFIEECKTKTGRYYFDRAWWTHRQVSMRLFRVGVLEYEFDNNDNVISIHIPSDAIITKENIINSVNAFNDLVNNSFQEYKTYKMICSSWLLSPKLKEHLKPNSNILQFQSFFDIVSFNEKDMSVIEWVFKVNSIEDFNDLSSDTSLQRSIKKSLLNNETIGSAFGILKDTYK